MITVVGSINMDIVSRVHRLPAPGETVLALGFFQSPGGKGANQAVAALRGGSEVVIVGRVGQDEHGAELLANLRRQGVSTHHVVVDPNSPTGRAMIAIDEQGENTIVVIQGANGQLSPRDVDHAGVIAESRIVVVQLEIPLETVARTVRLGHEAGSTVILNVAPARTLDHSVLQHIDVVVANREEIALMSGVGSPTDPAQAARMVLETGPRAVIVTLGEEGAVLVSAGGEDNIPAYATQVVDSVGAGDAFVGNLAHALDAGQDLPSAGRFASAAAALSVRREGAQTSMPSLAETIALLEAAS